MTYQLASIIRFEDTDYQIVIESTEGLFTPVGFGINPESPHTGLYNGYLAKYTCFDKVLYLHELHVACDASREDFPQIGNVKPRKGYSEFMQASGIIYDNMELRSKYSGGLLVGKMGITNQPFYINFHSFYLYVLFQELVFDNGSLLEQTDYSNKMANIREKIEAMPRTKHGKIPDELFQLMKRDSTDYAFDYFPHWSNRSKNT